MRGMPPNGTRKPRTRRPIDLAPFLRFRSRPEKSAWPVRFRGPKRMRRSDSSTPAKIPGFPSIYLLTGSAVLSTANITMQFGPKPLFENISVKFGEGNRYGLIGANGCGKSTFMKILGGDLEPSAGNVALEPNVRLGKLRQDQFAYEDVRVLDVVMMGHTEMWAAMTERDAIYANPEATDDDYMHAAELEAKFAEYGGYDAEARAGALLLGIGIEEKFHSGPMRDVAPGWKLRVLLAQALFSNPDVLLLDEPTNNLDINSIRWLEDTLNNYDSTMIIISHDRHFLNSVCTHMADMDYGTLKVWPGNYDDYMLASAQARERQAAANARAKERVAELQDFVRRFSANKSKARQATSRAKQIDKIKIEEFKPSSRQNPFIRFEFEKKLHNIAVVADSITKKYERTIFENFNLSVQPGERIAIIGENGAGKTTLLRALFGNLTLDHGTVKWAENANVGYMPQDTYEEFPNDVTLMDWIDQYRKDGDDETMVRGTLGRLLFSADDIKKSVKVLSGGEKGRMIWGKLMLGRHNVLLMDEPTNHMDMESIESLQIALEKFEGTLIFVSHDREFVSGLANRIIEVTTEGKLVDFGGNYEDFLASKGLQ
ncbi:heme ABC transporter ATP-binding protein [Burkholderia pseudomallei MSHR338]|uniref:Probable ATP-binding protein YbiT n=6 Tax=pseudomallei group TaxID=111527 RepID=A2S2E0_BURM9|nr:ABC transporter, ATP-binding protein [Burkholderia mallei SAVP1]ABN02256.1 ABC transporter, ATP-binding protein [Burkholderia mallei NCTC 10229]ABO05753.1 ABC transporter, ATP-binding protein [Burkholderia mallei NCTC 10247]ACQ95308.1 ABC transporter, ATP-binding protein [Burkholderia pseudomallei MSHR346]AFR16101.1 ABC transporter, ATP-binding protein [Burkholderia pseudomallei BPC006]EDK56583.1 ABC transporter, ATP-binding protein [Burkholderia mallei FMH]EDK60753.1 ABC transporter, ATP-